MKKLFILFNLCLFLIWNTQAQTWQYDSVSSGVNNGLISLTVYNGNFIAGGEFTTAGGNTANYIAQWNGSAWSALGSGMNGYVTALTVYNGSLIAGGDFTTAGGNTVNYIAQWNGSVWSALGSGMSGNAVSALIVYNGNLIAGGEFTTAGGNTVNSIAQWNGSAWLALGSGLNGGNVTALTVYNGNLIAGGEFTTTGGKPYYIAQWNGSVWSANLGIDSGLVGVYPSIFALTVYNGNLIAGGNFTSASGNPVNDIAQWNGSVWSALGSGVSNMPYSLISFNGNLYASDNNEWNGSSWSSIGGVLAFNSFTVYNNNLYAGGLNSSYRIVELTNVTGINQLSNSDPVKLFPNPNNGNFTISTPLLTGKAVVEIYNVLGEKVCNSTVNNNTSQINMNVQAEGIYLYRVLTENGTLISSGKFIVE